jgi:CheY-like chemotaxis protein
MPLSNNQPKMPAPPPVRVLLVDDEPSILEIFSQYLELSGYQVITGVDGEEALEKTRREKPDIIVLDIRMPKMDGWEVCERIKKDPSVCGIPVIFLTAFDQVQDHERARRLCVQGYIAKPCHPSTLVQQIKNCMKV